MHVLVTGGCGYVGSALVPKLLAAGHKVIVLDTQWFGINLQEHQDLIIMKRDIRDVLALPPCDAVIHLAGIANDPCGELDAKLTWEVNVLSTLRLAEACVRAGIKRFIFASSASVYGIQGDRAVREGDPLAPVSDYNKTKMCAERVLLSFDRDMAIQIVRPATICGYSPRMRLDVVVNMLTMRALRDHAMDLMTPTLSRPHCHIDDATDLYLFMLEHPEIVGTYNAGFVNQTILETAELISDYLKVPIRHTADSMDKRSYCVDSSKLLQAGFAPHYSVSDAIRDICVKYEAGSIQDDDRAYNLRWMKKNGLLANV